MKKEYGGYLPLETQNHKQNEYYECYKNFDLIKLNSGRACFYFAAKLSKIKLIYIPYFTCKETEVPFKECGVEIKKYYLNEKLLPFNINPKKDEFLLWTNYYGNASINDIKNIKNKYKNLIIDNCHAFFSKPINNAYNCYSTRKFFGVSDGAYLIKDKLSLDFKIDKDTSYENYIHLLKQLDIGTDAGYKESLINEERLNSNYKGMSRLTENLLSNIDYKKIKNIRRANFLRMHKRLKAFNKFDVNIKSDTHMYYPFLFFKSNIRYALIKNKIYNPFWWEHILQLVPEKSIEYKLSKYMIMLPIDQRYNFDDVDYICDNVMKEILK